VDVTNRTEELISVVIIKFKFFERLQILFPIVGIIVEF